ncbi:aryl-alcohol oxidase [Moniliophthora roreri MCA 2997]|uniref:Aryl-alcohol oxidase n=2 Tax=Moniliophthora roreri TaxID=221103 RepID=V2XA21_MONRO|nr:aryl-alcohol oxidase [Moniliophthora roreri MCA 2997]KAI3597835.1 aryl-alcohol oxidase [Moniliophthora roreri]
MKLLPSFVALLPFVAAELYTSYADIPNSEYDFVIVGGGTAGSILANRLTEDPNVNVLVLEAGLDNAGIQSIIVPYLAPNALHSEVDWNFTSTPQVGCLNQTVPVSRGYVLGGSSSINFVTWHRGSNDVWDTFARLSGDNGWGWPAMKKYNDRAGRLEPPIDGHDGTGQALPSAYGAHGEAEVRLPSYLGPLESIVVNTSKRIGGRWHYNEDFNAGDTTGTGFFLSSIRDGARDSAATAYLVPVLDRPNLDVVVHTRVTKLYTNGSDSDTPFFTTVEVGHDANSARRNFTASTEIILAAGVYGTPQILMLSGIGPQDELQRLGIPVLVNSPQVGQNLVDHPLLPNIYQVNATTNDLITRDQQFASDLLEQWETNRTGLLVVPPGGNTAAFLKNPDGFAGGLDPSSGPLSGNTEVIFRSGYQGFSEPPLPDTGNFISVITAVVSPTSRGSMTLQSNNPFDDPIIDLGLFTTDYDIQSMVQVMKDAEEFISQPEWEGYLIGPYGERANLTTDDDYATFARKYSWTVNHGVSTARMTSGGIEDGVVGADLLVKGTQGLRIIDGSVFPHLPENHIMANVFLLAERGADIVKASRRN